MLDRRAIEMFDIDGAPANVATGELARTAR